ncbi:MAG: hypothetical protein U0235_16765 [Polyangiaceae bacterium]
MATSARGSALLTSSLAKMIIRAATKSGSSPVAEHAHHPVDGASGSEPRIDLMKALTTL